MKEDRAPLKEAEIGFASNIETTPVEEDRLFQQFMGQSAQGTGTERGQEDVLAMESEMAALKNEGIMEVEQLALGAGYFTLRALGVAPLAAYKIVETDLQRTKDALVAPPPKAGKINSKTAEPKSFYSPEEVDRLTEEELKDPRILENVMQSMTKWKM